MTISPTQNDVNAGRRVMKRGLLFSHRGTLNALHDDPAFAWVLFDGHEVPQAIRCEVLAWNDDLAAREAELRSEEPEEPTHSEDDADDAGDIITNAIGTAGEGAIADDNTTASEPAPDAIEPGGGDFSADSDASTSADSSGDSSS